jgi:hypothetical protein
MRPDSLEKTKATEELKFRWEELKVKLIVSQYVFQIG